MIRRPPRSNRTDTLFPYTTLFRSMQQVMARNAIVVRKEDALDLPAITDVAVPVHLSPRERDAYDSMKQQLAAVLANGALATVPNRLAQMMRLRQITSGYVPDDTGVMQAIGDSKVDRQSVVEGKRGSVRVDLGGRRHIKKKKNNTKRCTEQQNKKKTRNKRK